MTEKQETVKADVVLSDGTEVYFDKHNIKPKEWRELFSTEQSEEDGQRIMARFACLEFEYVADLSMYDWQLLIAAAITKVREPVSPNLRSVSISQ
jgi:hypothetical protein